MNIQQHLWSEANGWTPSLPSSQSQTQLVLVFGPSETASDAVRDTAIHDAWPEAHRVFCSGGGQIGGTIVYDGESVVTAVSFDHASVRAVARIHGEGEDSADVGQRLGRELPAEGLRHVLVFSDGIRVNGSALVRGLSSALPPSISVTGGMAADDDRFAFTPVGLGRNGDGVTAEGNIVAIGLYGETLRIGMGTLGGWDVFGPHRLITRSEGNVLYELDGEPALGLYKRYLGPFAEELPASALMFPLRLSSGCGAENGDDGVVRTILGMDEEAGSLTFAGDMPEGMYARLMKANIDRIIDGAMGAAEMAATGESIGPRLGLLVSCVGRRWLLKQRVEEELESAQAVLGDNATLAGFYSYGEIAPMTPAARCELHNQTMTITTIEESAG